MKRTLTILFAAALTLLVSTSAFAQDGAKKSGLQIGVTGAANYSSFAYSNGDVPDDMSGYKLGFGGGVRAIYSFTDMFGIQPELLFVQRGNEATISALGQEVTSTSTLNYVQLPILARLNVPVGGDAITPKVVLGPTFGYFVSGTAEQGDNSADIESDDVNALEIGAAAGIGADFAAGPGSVSLDLRYFRGFTTIDSNDNSDDDAVNTGFSVMVGYNYSL